ncbi:MAG TPA: succinate dehydrogenase cytochrome b558 subunit [Pseudogracilibacillus sp.]|nr:succinate dehydrogenase cytochrome b558 subunit [Pseudogracilibacillus sp.]
MGDHQEYAYKRLHSLLGVVPIGIFVIQHLIVNHFAVYGEESFNKAAGFMENLPFVTVLEIFVIYLPILFHAVLGIYIVLATRNNVRRYGFFRNWMFFLQRISGIITLIFIAWHIWQTKIQIAFFNVELNYQLMEDILTQPFFFWFYAISIISVVFHLANGLWSFAVSWGIAQSPKSQQIVTYVTVGIFLVVSYIGIRSIVQFAFGA